MKDNSSNPKFVPHELRPAPFEGKKNAFIAPSKPLVLPTPKREVVVSKSLREMGQVPNINLVVCAPVTEKGSKRKKSAEKNLAPAPKLITKPTFTEAHVLSDELFITYTRGMSIHDKGGKALFYANGGGEIVHLHATLAFAWEALRKSKLAKVCAVKGGDFRRNTAPIDMNKHRVYVSPGQADPVLRQRAIETARQRASDEQWLKSAIVKRRKVA